MNDCLITFRSVTPAQRGEQVLRRAGLSCILQRTPRAMEVKGCGYCLRIPCEYVPEATLLLNENQIPYRKRYRMLSSGTMEEL